MFINEKGNFQVLPLIILILAILIYLILKPSETSHEYEGNYRGLLTTPSTTQINPHPSPTPKPNPLLAELIEFKLPTGWKQSFQANYDPKEPDTIVITSPYQAKGCCGGPITDAIAIYIYLKKDGNTENLEKKYKTIYDEIHDPNPGGAVSHTLSKTTVGDKPAISFLYDFEGHLHTYYIWNGNDRWEIIIHSPSKIYEEQYTDEIQAIITSLKFKNSD